MHEGKREYAQRMARQLEARLNDWANYVDEQAFTEEGEFVAPPDVEASDPIFLMRCDSESTGGLRRLVKVEGITYVVELTAKVMCVS